MVNNKGKCGWNGRKGVGNEARCPATITGGSGTHGQRNVEFAENLMNFLLSVWLFPVSNWFGGGSEPGLWNCVWIYLSVCNIPLHLMLSLMEEFNLLFWNSRTISEGQIPSESGRCCEGLPFHQLCHGALYASVLLFSWNNSHRKFNSEKIFHCRERVQTWAVNKIHCTVLHLCGFIPHFFRHFIAWNAWSRSVVALGSLCSGGMQVNTSRD